MLSPLSFAQLVNSLKQNLVVASAFKMLLASHLNVDIVLCALTMPSADVQPFITRTHVYVWPYIIVRSLMAGRRSDLLACPQGLEDGEAQSTCLVNVEEWMSEWMNELTNEFIKQQLFLWDILRDSDKMWNVSQRWNVKSLWLKVTAATELLHRSGGMAQRVSWDFCNLHWWACSLNPHCLSH